MRLRADNLGTMGLETKEEAVAYARVRRRGVMLGAIGIAVFFGSVIATIPVPYDLMVYPLTTMAVGLVFLIAGYLTMRKADKELLRK